MSAGKRAALAVLIPARNEASAIARCLQHVLDQDVDRSLMEVVVVDGGSTDGTGEIASSLLDDAGLARWVVHRNPGGTTPSNLNAGLSIVNAPIVCRVDARSLVPRHYMRTCISVLGARPEVAVVGGAQVAVPWSESDLDIGIARALNNRYGMGLSRYRRGARSGPSDTVYLGAFRVDDLRAAGGWDERFATNQDFELNRRMGRRGMIWFEDSLQVGYLPRRSVRELWAQYHRFGRWKVRYWRVAGERPRLRQIVLLAAPIVSLVGLLSIVALPRRRSAPTASGIVVAAVALPFVVEHLGCPDRGPGSGIAPGSELAQRGVAATALVSVWLAWSTGIWRELGSRARATSPGATSTRCSKPT